MSKKSMFIFFPTVLFHMFLVTSGKPLAPAIYVFGDSLVDSGNNNYLSTLVKANYEPYGIDMSKPTGRFSNGKTVADFLAEYLGLPLVPPYMGLSEMERSNTSTGLNYASGACGLLPQTGRLYGKCLHLNKQLDYFERTVKVHLPKQIISPKALKNYLAEAIYVVCMGSNDYINAYLSTTTNTSKKYTSQQFADILMKKMAEGVKRLYGLGARKMAVFELGPVGCIPHQRRSAKTKDKCVDVQNQMISEFNVRLSVLLKNLKSNLLGAVLVHGRIFNFTFDMQQSPSSFAEYLGLPLVPAYLALSDDQKKSTKTGLNFASGSCGIPDETGSIGDCLSFNEQIDFFQQTLSYDLNVQFPHPNELSAHLSTAIFHIAIGSNDYGNGLFMNKSVLKDPDEFTKHLVAKFSEALQRLYNLGARKFLIYDAGLVGCTPYYRHQQPDISKCDETNNDIISKFNDLLPGLLQILRSDLKGSTWVEVESCPLVMEILGNPSKYGKMSYIWVYSALVLELPLATRNTVPFYP